MKASKTVASIVLTLVLASGCRDQAPTPADEGGESNNGGPAQTFDDIVAALQTELPEECTALPGFSVGSLTLNNGSPVDLEEGESLDLSVTMTATPPANGVQPVCLVIRDAGIVINPIAGGLGFIGDGGDQLIGVLRVTCMDGQVHGAGVGPFAQLNRSSGERSTRIYVQHTSDEQKFLGLTTGIQGVKSNRIRVRCER